MDAKMVAEIKQPQVQNWMGKLQSEIDSLHVTIDDLSNKLAIVLAPSSANKAVDEKMPQLVPLAENLCIRTQGVMLATNRLRDIIDRLEL